MAERELPEVVEASEEESRWMQWRGAQRGVDTPGCDCGHDGMGIDWHAGHCRGKRAALEAAAYAGVVYKSDRKLRDDLIRVLSDTALRLGFTGTALVELPAYAQRLHDQWAAYRALGVAPLDRATASAKDVPGPARSPDQTLAGELARALGRPEDAPPDVLLHDVAELMTEPEQAAPTSRDERQAMAELHYPVGPYCVLCDVGPYGTGVNNPDCPHEYRHCHEDRSRAWPCTTARLWKVDEIWPHPAVSLSAEAEAALATIIGGARSAAADGEDVEILDELPLPWSEIARGLARRASELRRAVRLAEKGMWEAHTEHRHTLTSLCDAAGLKRDGRLDLDRARLSSSILGLRQRVEERRVMDLRTRDR